MEMNYGSIIIWVLIVVLIAILGKMESLKKTIDAYETQLEVLNEENDYLRSNSIVELDK